MNTETLRLEGLVVIPIGRQGLIKSGPYEGWYIFVEDDQENSGGYLILQYPDPKGSEGYDNWVEDREKLEAFFDAQGWVVDWEIE